MSNRYDRGRGQQKIVVPEIDDWRTRREEEPEPEETGSPWIRGVVQPAIVAILVGCVAWSVAELVADLTTATTGTLFWVVPVIMAAVGFRTQRIVQKRFLASSDSMRFRIIELLALFLVVKWASYFDNTPGEILAAIRGWGAEPLSFFDGETMIAYLLGVLGWLVAGATARDLDAVKDPTMYLGEQGPHSRLASRYFAGAAALLVFSALSRVNLRSVIEGANPRIEMPIVNALIYFLLGMVMLGQIQFARLAGIWAREKVKVTQSLGATWLRFSLLFLALVALVAFLLPTNYTLGLLDLVALLLMVISYIATLLYLLLLWPIVALLSLLMGRPQTAPMPSAPLPEFTPEVLPAATNGNPLWAILRSVLFWAVLLGVMIYVVRSYFRDRPALLASVRRFAPWRWLETALDAVWRWITGLGRKVGEAVPALVQRLRSLRRSVATARRERSRGPDPREQVLYHYLTTLDRAREEGIPRRETETPREYRSKLDHRVPETEPAMGELTEAFIEARYSTHPVTPEDVAEQEAHAASVRRALEQHAAAQEAEQRRTGKENR